MPAASYDLVAEAAWRWVLAQVRRDDGPWIPTSVTGATAGQPPADRDGMHSGIGGLAYVLAEITLLRPWTEPEQELAAAIGDRLRRQLAGDVDCTLFDGLVSSIGAFVALGQHGAQQAVARLNVLATPDGWPQTAVGPPGYPPHTRLSDATLGTAGVLIGALWAMRHGCGGATELAEQAAAVLLAEQKEVPAGSDWPFIPDRFLAEPRPVMPNYSHGVGGIAAALAVAGVELGRPDLVSAARSGAEQLITYGDSAHDGFVVPVQVPMPEDSDRDPVTYSWCHGPTGTRLLFLALERAQVREVAGEPPASWHRRCLRSVQTSGVPTRLHPGFWDNDGRCCGTAGVGDAFLDDWQRTGNDAYLEFAVELGDALVERVLREGPYAYWRFVEHRAEEPLLPPGVGWMQGAAGIAAFLFRLSRVLAGGRSVQAIARMDSWWALPA